MDKNNDDVATVIVQEVGNAGVIILNRPEVLNALNTDMFRKKTAALQKFEESKALVILKGAGDKAFCAGGDLLSTVDYSLENTKNFYQKGYRIFTLIKNFRIPYVSLIDGITMGGGVGISINGKYCVATEKTIWAMPENAIGHYNDAGSGYFLPRLRGKLGIYLGLTGFHLKGKDVVKSGVATHYCESSNLPELEAALTKCSTDQDVAVTLDKFCPQDNSEFILQKHLGQIDECFSGGTMEEILDRLRKDNSEWAQKTLQTLAKMCPTSLKISKKIMDLGANMTPPEVEILEYRISVRRANDSDLKEGIRAMFVDKDKLPKWNPSTLEEVTDEFINSFFQPLPDDLNL